MTRRPAQGFTLIELLVALTILGVLATLAAPSFRNLLESQRMKGALAAIGGLYDNARWHAVRQRSDVVFVFQPGNNNTWQAQLTSGGATLQSVTSGDYPNVFSTAGQARVEITLSKSQGLPRNIANATIGLSNPVCQNGASFTVWATGLSSTDRSRCEGA
ncbi:prepilin-type N-terminal cleavage/methylation domain-containing protein [Crenobacter cavernae]|uniref:Prepilin-type N-terminal cleavage/methylation domain-containing protein n=1 Tax=Crenobacter cavernae TaxID=2290923 RepID=A0A345Y471_9NEIS|nr:prepilin-type N-terminal cleavage/methylation domain-containing protein [Crenobacter cavernae]AXK38723.1 prepilin-type N-terminal cleavage/methylation domain-containing protein [Crenobacter cavernae]